MSPVPKEISSRCQLADISSIFVDFMCYLDISWDFMHVHGFRGPGLSTDSNGVLPQLFQEIPKVSCALLGFMRYHRLPQVSRLGVVSELNWSPAPKEAVARSQLIV